MQGVVRTAGHTADLVVNLRQVGELKRWTQRSYGEGESYREREREVETKKRGMEVYGGGDT